MGRPSAEARTSGSIGSGSGNDPDNSRSVIKSSLGLDFPLISFNGKDAVAQAMKMFLSSHSDAITCNTAVRHSQSDKRIRN